MELLERHRRFWSRERVDKALVGVSRQGVFFLEPFIALEIKDGILTPESIPDPGKFIQIYYDKVIGDDPLDGDIFWVAKPPRALPWMEAIAGCQLMLSTSSGTISPLVPDDFQGFLDLDSILVNNPWLDLYIDFTDKLSDYYRDQIPMGQSLLRGPSDMMTALLGYSRFCVDSIEQTRMMKELAFQCATLWIEVLKLQYEHLHLYKNGYLASPYGLWSPKPVAAFQEDAVGFLSPAIYKEIFYECDELISNSFDYSILHLHSAALQMLVNVLEISNLRGVNIVIDSKGPNIGSLIPVFQKIQNAKKALHVQGIFTDRDMMKLEEALSPNGLCLFAIMEELNEFT
jgi:hypothetical protein